MEDDCACPYDSTWEPEPVDPAEESQDKIKSGWNLGPWNHTSRNIRAAKDMQNYRRGYPNRREEECSEDKMFNLQFYLNKFPSAPDDVYIDSFLRDWKNDYKRLERVHSYIQWLFPLREPGVNYMASELTKKEIEAFKNSEEAKRRLVESYELMLGFYGIRLVNKETGEVKRAENWKERFGNLERNMHNNLRITRILKSLGELGFSHYQAPLVHFFLEETLVKKTLSSVKRSVLDYFLFAVKDKQMRQELLRFAYFNYEPKDKFVWCPRRIQKQFKKGCEPVGNGDWKVAQQKEPGELDNGGKAQKGSEKPNNDRHKPGEASPQRKPEATAESSDDAFGNDSADDVEMQSPTPDTVTKTEPGVDGEGKPNDDAGDALQEPDNMQTDGNADKPPKKKREDKAPPSNGAGGDLAAVGATEGGAGTDKASGQASPSAQTPHKISKHSPSLSSARDEKIPRTDFNQVPYKKVEAEASQGAANGSADEGAEAKELHPE